MTSTAHATPNIVAMKIAVVIASKIISVLLIAYPSLIISNSNFASILSSSESELALI
jgi:hypothetical protein